MALAIAVAVLVAGGLYLVLQKGIVRLVFGLVLISHAVNLVLVAAGGTQHRAEPLLGGPGTSAEMADPLPQAFVLTAIVIFFGITIYLLTLAVAGPVDRVLEEAAGDEPSSGRELHDAAEGTDVAGRGDGDGRAARTDEGTGGTAGPRTGAEPPG